MRASAPAFPMARYYARKGEWEHARERLARDAVSYRDVNYDPLITGGRMTLLDATPRLPPASKCASPPDTIATCASFSPAPRAKHSASGLT